MTSIIPTILATLLSIIVQGSIGQVHHYYPGGNFLDNLLADVILQLIDFVQNGLIEANIDNFPVPDLSVSLDGKTFEAILYASDIRVVGVTGFKVKNISSNLFGLYSNLDVIVPDVEVKGNYELKGKTLGLSIYGKGPFSLKISQVELGGRGQLLKGLNLGQRPFSWKISNFFLSIGQVRVTLDGLMGDAKRDAILLITGIVVASVIILLSLGFIVTRIYNRIFKRN